MTNFVKNVALLLFAGEGAGSQQVDALRTVVLGLAQARHTLASS